MALRKFIPTPKSPATPIDCLVRRLNSRHATDIRSACRSRAALVVEFRLSLSAAVFLSPASPVYCGHPDHGDEAAVRHQPRRFGGSGKAVSQELSSLQKRISRARRTGGGGRKRRHGEKPPVRGASWRPA